MVPGIFKNRTSLFHFTISLLFIIGVTALITNPVWRELVAQNIFYIIALTGVILFPLVYFKSINWIFGSFSLWTWTFFLIVLGTYYAWFGEPNIIGLIVNVFKSYPVQDRLLGASFGLLSYGGLVFSFYFLIHIITPADAKDTLLKIPLLQFLLKMGFYLFYLNGIILFMNAIFLKNM
ncbi:MAG: hypothetical protein ABUK01_09700 [Leptospirales bacterium]